MYAHIRSGRLLKTSSSLYDIVYGKENIGRGELFILDLNRNKIVLIEEDEELPYLLNKEELRELESKNSRIEELRNSIAKYEKGTPAK